MFVSNVTRFTPYLVICFCLLFLTIVLDSVSGHNWQRAAQIMTAFFSFIVLVRYSTRRPDIFLQRRTDRFACFLIICLGLLSAVGSHQTLWAFVEVALLMASCCIACVYAVERRIHGSSLDFLILVFVVVLCAVKTIQFFSAVAAVFTSGVGFLDTVLLFDGFSNRRTYGQFQTFTLPLLALPLLIPTIRHSAKALIFALLACWWMIAICGGTRGTWLGMGGAGVLLICLGPQGRRWASWQLGAALAGCLLYWGLFTLMPAWMGIKILNLAGERLTTNLSAREIIWQQAWEMIKARPLLGYGPMHFADIQNYVAAHPHQIILQWACEWGVPSALLVGWMVLRGLAATTFLTRAKAASIDYTDALRLCLFGCLIGALTQSMVDGVIVMPYSQLWLCLVVGWLLGLQESKVVAVSSPLSTWVWLCAVGSSVALLAFVIARDFPHLDEQQQQYQRDVGGNYQPRFWQQGVIATRPQ